jgi:hypothetical protein
MKKSLLFGAALAAGAWLTSGPASATCWNTTSSCTAPNGCIGERTCTSQGWTPCLADPECVPPTPTPVPLLPDTFTWQQASLDQVGLLVDGASATTGARVEDQTSIGQGNGNSVTIPVGKLRGSGSSTNEILAFSVDRAPSYFSTPWTGGVDSYGGALDPPVNIPLTIWVMHGSFATEAPIVASRFAMASALYRNERTGIWFSSLDIRDATMNPNTQRLLAVNDNVRIDDMMNSIGAVPGRVNVYWVTAVNGGTGSGVQWAGVPAAAVGHDATGNVIAHELGHAFVLEHVDGMTGYGTTNVMQSQGGSKAFFTEGQTFRMHFHPSSALHFAYGARPWLPMRACSRDTTSAICPANLKRIWADGALPPN